MANYKAWSQAEKNCTQRLASVLGVKYNKAAFVGDEVTVIGKVNIFVFAIVGGGEQPQQYETGGSSWHTLGILKGIYKDRDTAMQAAGKIMDAVPFINIPHVQRLYMQDHPIIVTKFIEVANTERLVTVSELTISFGVVYHG